MATDINMILQLKDITTGSRRVTVDRRTGTEILMLEKDYLSYANKGNFGFMINPDFAEGVYK